jgi:hypothetical protein
MKGRRVKQVFSRSEYQREGDGHKGKGSEGECGGCILYSYAKIEE